MGKLGSACVGFDVVCLNRHGPYAARNDGARRLSNDLAFACSWPRHANGNGPLKWLLCKQDSRVERLIEIHVI